MLAGVSDKWAKFGLAILETTLETNCCSKSDIKTTQELPKLLTTVENYFQMFMRFMIEDSDQFELLVNPRSLRIDIDSFNLTFDLSNEKNMLWVRISLTLNPSFLLNANHISIDNVVGSANKTELANMILTIRPSGHYLTRVAECIDDYISLNSK